MTTYHSRFLVRLQQSHGALHIRDNNTRTRQRVVHIAAPPRSSLVMPTAAKVRLTWPASTTFWTCTCTEFKYYTRLNLPPVPPMRRVRGRATASGVRQPDIHIITNSGTWWRPHRPPPQRLDEPIRRAAGAHERTHHTVALVPTWAGRGVGGTSDFLALGLRRVEGHVARENIRSRREQEQPVGAARAQIGDARQGAATRAR